MDRRGEFVSGRLFDERFARAAADIQAYAPVRLAWLVAVAGGVGLGVGWSVGGLWAGAALLAEAALLIATRHACRGRAGQVVSGRACAVVYLLASLTWSMAGLLLWSAETTACQLAAGGVFAAHLMYLQARHGPSPGAALPILPSVALPAVAPLALPHFQGTDQVLVCLAMLALVLHALGGLWTSLRASAALQGAQAALAAAEDHTGAFLARMSHEIRTPLNGVLGAAQALSSEPDVNPAHRRSLAVLRESGESLLSILNDVLDLSRAQAGRLELEKVAFDLGDAVRPAQARFGALAATKGLALRLDLDPRAAGVYLGDPARVRQIIETLLSNAVKFTDRGQVTLALAWRNEVLEIQVTDSGLGARDLARLFHEPRHGGTSAARRYGGAGFGLVLCRELAGLMGGAIEVESTPGVGARFTVLLPLRRLGDTDTPPRDLETAAEDPLLALMEGGPPLRVLAAEDHPANQFVLKALLAQVGIEPDLVADGAAAVEAWRTAPYDLILMDIQMPVMDGVAATEAIRKAEQAQGRPRTPILALTANAMPDQVSAYLAAGFDGHVAKPIDASRLYAALSAVTTAQPAAEASNPRVAAA